MGEYDRKQRNQLSKTISHSESNSSQLKGFADNRPQTIDQTSIIDSIQKKPNNTRLPDNLKSGIENLSGNKLNGIGIIQRVLVSGIDIISSTDLTQIKRALKFKSVFRPITVTLSKETIEELIEEIEKRSDLEGDLLSIYNELLTLSEEEEDGKEEEEEETSFRVEEEQYESPDDFPYAEFPKVSGKYTLIGVHETYESNIQSLLTSGPAINKIGTKHGTGKGPGFYVTPVGERKLSTVITSELRYGTRILAVYFETRNLSMIEQAAALEWVIPKEAFSSVKLARTITDAPI